MARPKEQGGLRGEEAEQGRAGGWRAAVTVKTAVSSETEPLDMSRERAQDAGFNKSTGPGPREGSKGHRGPLQ